MTIADRNAVAGASSRDADVLFVGFVLGTGGVSTLMLELAVRYAARGVRTRIVVPDWDDTSAYAERAAARGVAVTRTPLLRERGPRWRGVLDALRFVRGFAAPVVHYHPTDNTLPAAFLHAMRLLRPPKVFVTPHSPNDDVRPDSPLAHRWAAAVTRHVETVLCISRGTAARQRSYGVPESRLRVVHNGIDLARFAGGDGRAARRELGLPDAAPIVLVAARLAGQKRPLDAVEAFRRVAAGVPDAHLVFIGEGAMRGETEAAARAAGLGPRAHFLGLRTDVENWLAAATVWFLPTESEGFSLGVVEAMAAGKAIVTTRCPGNDEALTHDRNALLTDVGDVAGQADALRRLLTDPPLRARLGERARRDASQYSLDGMVDAYLECYAAAGRRLPRAATADATRPAVVVSGR